MDLLSFDNITTNYQISSLFVPNYKNGSVGWSDMAKQT